MKQLLEKFYFEFLHALNFSCTWNKTIFCRLNIVTFWRNIAYTVNSFLFFIWYSWMIKILNELIKILHAKMLNAIYLYWFHNDISEKK